MKLEAAAWEVAVDDPVRVGDVGPVSRRPAVREVVVVRAELAEHRRCARARQTPPQRPHLLERDLHVDPLSRGQHTRKVHGMRDLAAVGLGRARAEPARRHGVLQRRQRRTFAGHGRRPRSSTRHDQQGCEGEQQPGETPHTHDAG